MCFLFNVISLVSVFSLKLWLLPALEAVKVSPLIEKVSDHKDFKKLLRTRTNVLVLYTKTGWSANNTSVFESMMSRSSACLDRIIVVMKEVFMDGPF